MPLQDPAPNKPTAKRSVYRDSYGTRLPSVTEVLNVIDKPGLVKWASNLGLQGLSSDTVRDQRAAEGTVMHEYVRAHLTESEPDLSPFSPSARAGGLVAFLRWKRHWLPQHTLRLVLIEQPLVHEEWGYGGTPDLIAEIDNRVEVCDWKTSKVVSREHVIQGAAYLAMAWANGHKARAVRIVHVSCEADGGWGEVIETNLHDHVAAFRAALALTRALSVLGKPEDERVEHAPIDTLAEAVA